MASVGSETGTRPATLLVYRVEPLSSSPLHLSRYLYFGWDIRHTQILTTNPSRIYASKKDDDRSP